MFLVIKLQDNPAAQPGQAADKRGSCQGCRARNASKRDNFKYKAIHFQNLRTVLKLYIYRVSQEERT